MPRKARLSATSRSHLSALRQFARVYADLACRRHGAAQIVHHARSIFSLLDKLLMKRLLITATSLVLAVTSASAALYSCSVQEQGTRSGWVPPTVLVAVRDDGAVYVSDPIGAAVAGEPSEAAVLNDSGQTLSVRWQVRGALSATNQLRISFTPRSSMKTAGLFACGPSPRATPTYLAALDAVRLVKSPASRCEMPFRP